MNFWYLLFLGFVVLGCQVEKPRHLLMKPRRWTNFWDLRKHGWDWLFEITIFFVFIGFGCSSYSLFVVGPDMGSSSGEAKSNGIDASVGGLVWVRRRNGSWWPGRIMGLDELSEGSLVSPRSGTPVKLLGREDASVWVSSFLILHTLPTCLPWLLIGFLGLARFLSVFVLVGVLWASYSPRFDLFVKRL